MLKLQRRLETLENALRPKRRFAPYEHRIVFVDGDGTRTGFMTLIPNARAVVSSKLSLADCTKPRMLSCSRRISAALAPEGWVFSLARTAAT